MFSGPFWFSRGSRSCARVSCRSSPRRIRFSGSSPASCRSTRPTTSRTSLCGGGGGRGQPALVPVLIVVETTDVMFAPDSVPAILAITRDPFIVYTSNVFAILGLRPMFFLLAGIMGLFRYLKVGLCIVLMFVGVKMLISDIYKIPIAVSLGMVVSILASSVLASVIFPPAEGNAAVRSDGGIAAPAGRVEEEETMEHRRKSHIA